MQNNLSIAIGGTVDLLISERIKTLRGVSKHCCLFGKASPADSWKQHNYILLVACFNNCTNSCCAASFWVQHTWSISVSWVWELVACWWVATWFKTFENHCLKLWLSLCLSGGVKWCTFVIYILQCCDPSVVYPMYGVFCHRLDRPGCLTENRQD